MGLNCAGREPSGEGRSRRGSAPPSPDPTQHSHFFPEDEACHLSSGLAICCSSPCRPEPHPPGLGSEGTGLSVCPAPSRGPQPCLRGEVLHCWNGSQPQSTWESSSDVGNADGMTFCSAFPTKTTWNLCPCTHCSTFLLTFFPLLPRSL